MTLQNFTMNVHDDETMRKAFAMIELMMSDGKPINLSACFVGKTRKTRGASNYSLADRMIGYMQSYNEPVTSSVMSNKMKVQKNVVEEMFAELESKGLIKKEQGRMYGGILVEKWVLVGE